jgi:hypothetical protein
VRAEPGPGAEPDPPAFYLDVDDAPTRGSLDARTWKISDITIDRYANYEFGPLPWSITAYAWLAPADVSNAVCAVYIDRFELE